ncbi:MAG: hypothetical protein ACXVWU_03415 [Nocardioides sp.]
MGNVNLPTPVALAGGAICVLGGYLLGVVAGPDRADPRTATVASYDAGAARLCLEGGAVSGDAATKDGVLCGTWRPTAGSATPHAGDAFRFVTMSPGGADGHASVTLIYGDVVASGR